MRLTGSLIKKSLLIGAWRTVFGIVRLADDDVKGGGEGGVTDTYARIFK